MKPYRVAVDVADLPTVTFGQRGLLWWGTLFFVIIEGWTLAIIVAAYYYVRQGSAQWPPTHTPLPSLTIPTIQLVVMLMSLIPIHFADRAARRLDKPTVRLWLTVGSALLIAIAILRWFEFWSLNVRWDSNAYGSAEWNILGWHATLIAVELGELVGMAAVMYRANVPVKYMSDTCDLALYYYYLILVWVPLYVVAYWVPRMF